MNALKSQKSLHLGTVKTRRPFITRRFLSENAINAHTECSSASSIDSFEAVMLQVLQVSRLTWTLSTVNQAT